MGETGSAQAGLGESWERSFLCSLVENISTDALMADLLARVGQLEPDVCWSVTDRAGHRYATAPADDAGAISYDLAFGTARLGFAEGRVAEAPPCTERFLFLASLALRSASVRGREARESAEHSLFVNNSLDAMFLHDEDCLIVDVNQRACEMLECSRQELIGSRPTRFEPLVTAELMSSIRAGLDTGDTVAFESVQRRRDGSEFPVEVRARPFVWEGQKLTMALVTDITERKQNKALVERHQLLLAESQRLAGLGCFDWDLKTGQLWWSEVLYGIYGLDPARFQPTLDGFLDRVHPEDRQKLVAELQASIESGGSFSIEERVIRPDGEIRFLESRGQVVKDGSGRSVRVIGACLDVTQPKKVEMASRQMAEALVRAQQMARLESWEFDAESRHFSFSSSDKATMSFEQWLNLVHPDDRGRVEDFLGGALAGASQDFEYRSAARPARWFRCRSQAAGGSELLGVTQDITEQRELEQQLREAQKMEALGRLAGGVAHDFNNLLGVINGYVQILEDGSEGDELAQEALSSIREAAERAAALTRQLLTFSRRTSSEPKTLDLNEAVRDALRLLRRLLGQDIVLDVSQEESHLPVYIDPNQLQQVLMNLAINARDAMPEGGQLTIQTGSQPDGWLRMMVGDTGTGIAQELRDKVFEPFFTTKGLGKGTGLGLAVVHGVVERWGGRILVDSEPGRGTVFNIDFPRAVQTEAAGDGLALD